MPLWWVGLGFSMLSQGVLCSECGKTAGRGGGIFFTVRNDSTRVPMTQTVARDWRTAAPWRKCCGGFGEKGNTFTGDGGASNAPELSHTFRRQSGSTATVVSKRLTGTTW